MMAGRGGRREAVGCGPSAACCCLLLPNPSGPTSSARCSLAQAALARNEPVSYNKPDPLNPFFVVYGRLA